MEKTIKHQGTIVAIGVDKVTVRLHTTDEECGKCAIAKLCNRGTDIEVPYPGATTGLIGQTMTVEIAPGSQRRAIVVFFVVPLALLVGVLALALALGASQMLAASLSITAIILWLLIAHYASRP